MVNLVAGLESWVANPSYRPTFNVHWLPSLAGAVGCGFVMFILSPPAFLLAASLIIGLYSLLTRRRFQTAWGDMRSGFWFAMTRMGLLKFSASRQHVHNWRPVFLVLAGNPNDRLALVKFAGWLEAHRGLLFLAQVVTGDWKRLIPHQSALQRSMEDFIREQRLSAVAKTVLADDFEEGVSTLLQVAGLGALQPNTVLVGWSEDAVNRQQFVRTVGRILSLQKNLLVFAEAELPAAQLDKHIDVWWRAKENGSLMLTLAHLLQAQPRWRDHTVRVLRVIGDTTRGEEARQGIQHLLEEARIEATAVVLVSTAPVLEVVAALHGNRRSVSSASRCRRSLNRTNR